MTNQITIGHVGNYPPRQCGIATFTRDVVNAISGNQDQQTQIQSIIMAMTDEGQSYDYPACVDFKIRQNHQRDYIRAAQYLNGSEADICLLQHEFGIFGGESGLYLLALIDELKIPLVTILHTVLEHPAYQEQKIIQRIGKASQRVVVMTQRAVIFLTDIYGIPHERISLIYHGVPQPKVQQGTQNKKKLGFAKKKLLLTFGLLSPNKGIETVIHALPHVVREHPDVVYLVLGSTHPNIVKTSGEAYRNALHRLVKKHQLENHVVFYDHFISNQELFEYLSAVDIYITPYLNMDQITSGTLAYAIGAGAATVSTPYWHAKDLLGEGRGRLFDCGDHHALADILSELLGNQDTLNELRKNARAFGEKTSWPAIGKQYLLMLQGEIANFQERTTKRRALINPQELPIFSLDHVQRLTDRTGIMQHAKFTVPNRKEGYCLDDAARALLMITMAYRQKGTPAALDLIPIYLSFIDYMQREDGLFHNFLGPTGEYLDTVGSEDAFGRAVWALGHFVRYSLNDSYVQMAKHIFEKATPHMTSLKTMRGEADCIIGLAHYLIHYRDDTSMRAILEQLTTRIVERYHLESDAQWKWFEPVLAYDNAITPLALLYAYRITKDAPTLRIATESMNFLDTIIFPNDHPSIIGNEQWYHKGQERSRFAQQPIDAMALVLLYRQAYFVFKKPHYIRKMHATFNWFLGENDLGLPLYDPESRGCRDGIEHYGINKNQGAESTLAYLIAHLAVLTADEAAILKEA